MKTKQTTPLNPTRATRHNFWRHNFRKSCDISAVRTSYLPKVALQQARNRIAKLEKARRRKAAPPRPPRPRDRRPPRFEGQHINPDTRAFLARTHSDTQAVPACRCIQMFKAFFRHASMFKTHGHAVHQCLKKPPTLFRNANVFKTLFDTRMSVFLMRVFAHLSGPTPRLPRLGPADNEQQGWHRSPGPC